MSSLEYLGIVPTIAAIFVIAFLLSKVAQLVFPAPRDH